MELLDLLPKLGILLLLLTCPAAGAALSPAASPTSNSPKTKPTPSPPAAATPTTRPGSSPGSTLDPKQLSALQSMNLPTTKDPCNLPFPHNYTTCDNSSPFRHLISLTLSNCSSDLDLSTTALRSLSSTLTSLSFLHCPIPPVRLPSQLFSNLRSFSCVSSLRRLSGVYLSHLANLTDLTVVDVPVNASGPWIILSQMRLLRTLTITRTNLTGGFPHHWHTLNLTHMDLSENRLRGPIPASIGRLESLEFLNLSSNSLTGSLPDTVANLGSLKNASFAQNSLSGPLPDSLTELPALVHLDLSSNQFNGSVPRFLSEMKGLKYLNLENNNFHGVIPFNVSFIKRLEVLKIGGNSNLCYNHTLLSSKLKLGIAPCDRYEMPVPPPPDRTARSDSSSYSDDNGDYGNGDKGNDGGGHHGPGKIVLGVAIGLSCLVFLILFLVCLSKMCG